MTTFLKRLLLLLVLLLFVEGCRALAPSTGKAAKGQNLAAARSVRQKKWLRNLSTPLQWTSDIAIGYQRRVAADPSFPLKSATEIVVAASTQFAAEWSRRGRDQLLPQFDFVLAGVLTAVYGKYAAMWKVAQTKTTTTTTTTALDEKEKSPQQMTVRSILIPTNAFQPFLLDGVTRPSISQRLQSLLLPVGPLFRAGFLASLVGYGFTAVLIAIRSWLVRESNCVCVCACVRALLFLESPCSRHQP
jgi:Protein RETICULATA-related